MILLLVLVGLWAGLSEDDPGNPSAFKGFVFLIAIGLLFLIAVGQLLGAIIG
jgi:hypothetical protein